MAGPDLPHADAEIAALHEAYPGSRHLRGPGATVDVVLGALGSAEDLAHVPAHGEFRADNPLFSYLRLADGPLFVYDLETLQKAPRRIVLSACDSARAAAAGEELLGLSAVFFALGTRTLVASVIRVPDAHTRELMLALHRRLRAGAAQPSRSPARRRTFGGSNPDDTGAWAGFVCLGAG